MKKIISLDTETTGKDVKHDARPFFVTTSNLVGDQLFWEWDVDPLTRMPIIPPEDLEQIKCLIQQADELVLQNPQFDYQALLAVIPDLDQYWDWDKIRDTLLAGHLLASNQPHNLTDMAAHYLGENIYPLEEKLGLIVNEARRKARLKRHNLNWKLAKGGLDGMPSAKSGAKENKMWKYDMWLPRCLIKYFWEKSESYQIWEAKKESKFRTPRLAADKASQASGWEYHPPEIDPDEVYGKCDPYWTALRDYSNADSAVTIALWQRMEQLLKERQLWDIYQTRLKVLPIAAGMQVRGVTISSNRVATLYGRYESESLEVRDRCVRIAASYGYELNLPKSSNNKSLLEFVFYADNGFKERSSNKLTDTGNFAFDKYVLADLVHTYEENKRSKKWLFYSGLQGKRKRDTALGYMESYQDFWKIIPELASQGWCTIHPWLNPTGTATLRWSSSGPNEQQISKQGMFEGDKYSLRYCFGPKPGREWWSCDAKNIELRLPAYESGEEEMVALFERPDDPPYFGSNHLLVSHILHPKLFDTCLSCKTCSKEIWVKESTSKREKCCECAVKNGQLDGRIFKKKYASTWYQWVKNGNFAVTYGAVAESGTADRAYHVPGGQAQIEARFKKIKELNQRCIRQAEKTGFVETMPDRTVDPKRGYPLMCTRTEWGKVLPTVPLNYHIQGTAMWWTMQAMIRCQAQLDEWNKKIDDPAKRYYLCLQVHDEMVFDFPKAEHPVNNPGKSNLARIKVLQKLMEQGGEDLIPRVPTPVGIEYHEESWSEGVTLA